MKRAHARSHPGHSTERHESRLGAACLALLALVPGCGQGGEEPALLTILQVSPEAGASGVFLNERVLLYFSQPLDPASLHARSARIVDPLGRPARGHWEVEGKLLSFTPDPVLSPRLDDGGYRPGVVYTVELAGFPRPDGLRGLAGAPLARSAAWSFQVVQVDDPTRRGFLFEDASLDTGRPLILRSERIGPRDPILLEGEEPVDPSTLFGEDFVLQAWRRAGAETSLDGEREPSSTEFMGPVSVRARLVDNRDRRDPRARGSTWIELQPSEPLWSGAEYIYQVHLAPGARLRDFSGHPVLILPRTSGPTSHLHVESEGTAAPLVYAEHFMGTDNRSAVAVAGADGTAWWGGQSGRVEVRFPAAAGDGRAGNVSLTGQLPAADLAAVRLSQSADVETDLSDLGGAVVLRAQGSIQLDGRLLRRGDHGVADFLAGETLSAWLERIQAEGRAVTVLVAGGDIIIAGTVQLEGPLVLAAGGRVRLVSSDWIQASSLHVVGERGGQGSFRHTRTDAIATILAAPLEMDAPTHNPLVEPLTFAVRSGPIPRQGRVKRWHPLLIAPGGHQGSGAFRVRFLGERSQRTQDQAPEVLVDDPMLLSDCPTLRLQVELSIEPGPLWDPPWVDFVELSWEIADPEAGR